MYARTCALYGWWPIHVADTSISVACGKLMICMKTSRSPLAEFRRIRSQRGTETALSYYEFSLFTLLLQIIQVWLALWLNNALGLWLRLECSLDSLSIDSAHVIYVSEGYDVAYNRRTASQPSYVVLRVTWYVKTFRNVNYVCWIRLEFTYFTGLIG